ncbi:ChrR family anti-sigma-E factor [Rhodospira trueperi]|uniref:Putative transcriptional regulator n=1 Tax=Rhodospira trueperi TaxID=69960 RepID=A0A1G6YIB7_9PROT|nr:ChrR family anti-sigma-E factor [Rhodospira trueperi]SDD90090.1 putative transcriptional regulator [Rhodospira trueperi]
MTVKHHPSEALLLAYAAGQLGEGLSLLIATHMTYCPACRGVVADAEAMGGALLEDSAAVKLSEGALSAVLARLDAPMSAQADPTPVTRRRATSSPARQAGQDGIRLPAPIRAYVGDIAHARWQWVAPGVRQLDLMQRPKGRDTARLLRISPGRVLPHHGHAGLELTVVLQGSFSDEQGRFTPGDLAELDRDDNHQPIADSGEDCICVIGTDAPLRFSGLLPRMMAPMMGF